MLFLSFDISLLSSFSFCLPLNISISIWLFGRMKLMDWFEGQALQNSIMENIFIFYNRYL